MRRRIRRGLLKVERLDALARDLFYGRRGRINARKLWEQRNTCTANADLPGPQHWRPGRQWSRSLPAGTRHPVEWENVVLCGPTQNLWEDRSLVKLASPRAATNLYTDP